MTPSVPITVLMPVFNAERWLKQAIESILQQTFTDFEFLIIDDGSTDSSRNIIQSYEDSRINLVLNSDNRGLIYSLNHGLSLAKGKYIARMDADDISLPERLKIQYNFMEAHEKVVLSSGFAEKIDPSGKSLEIMTPPVSDAEIKTKLYFASPIIHPLAIYHKHKALEVKGYQEDHKYAEDYGLWLKMAKAGELANIPEIMLQYRRHPEAESCSHQHQQGLTACDISYAALHEVLGEQLDQDSYRKFWFYWFKDGIPPDKSDIYMLEPLFSFVSHLKHSRELIYPYWVRSGTNLIRKGHIAAANALNKELKKYFQSGLGLKDKLNALRYLIFKI